MLVPWRRWLWRLRRTPERNRFHLVVLKHVSMLQPVASDPLALTVGASKDQVLRELAQLVDDGLLTAEKVVRDGSYFAADGLRITDRGMKELADTWYRALEHKSPPVPAAGWEAWAAVEAIVEPFSRFEAKVREARGRLVGSLESKESIVEAMRIAHAAGYHWDARRREFRRPFPRRIRKPAIVIAGVLAFALPLVFRSKGTSVAEAVSAAATAAAVFVALYAVAAGHHEP